MVKYKNMVVGVTPDTDVDAVPASAARARAPNLNAEESSQSEGTTAQPIDDTTAKATDEVAKSSAQIANWLKRGEIEISEATMDGVKQQAKEGIPRLQRGVKYTARQICGPSYWKVLSKADKIMTGMALAKLVADKQLPLAPAGTNWSNARVYSLI
jgi:hypothetical protein